MLSIDINYIDGKSKKTLAHIQITERRVADDQIDFGNYRWRIQDSDGSMSEGELNNFDPDRGSIELLWQVLSLWMIGRENQQMADEFLRGLISISAENLGVVP